MIRISQLRLGLLLLLFVAAIFSLNLASAASKPHVITFGKWTTVQWFPAFADDNPLTLKVRPLLVDSRVKELTFGPAHEVTERIFVVRRAFRVNDSLPQEPASSPHWQW